MRHIVSWKSLDRIKESFSRGDVVVYPTDTLYGIGCVVNSKESVERIYSIKQRERKKPLSVGFGSLEQMKEYVDLTPEQEKEILDSMKNFKGHYYTFIVEKNGKIEDFISQVETVGARLFRYRRLNEVIKEVGPIVSTSANLSGEKSPRRYSEVDIGVLGQADLVIKGDCISRMPSTIYDLIRKKLIRRQC